MKEINAVKEISVLFLNNTLFALGSAYKWQQLIPSGKKVSDVHRKLCCVQNQRTVDYSDNFADGDADADADADAS